MSIEEPIFWDYLEFYPYKDYDGVHDGGIKGISEKAPNEAKKSFREYMNAVEQTVIEDIKL
jgi:hypothetical protein